MSAWEVAVVGSGPSGFYAAEALLRAEQQVRVSMIERLPSPFGLVRSGVAPDHPKLKQVIRVFDKTARSRNFRFFGNTEVGEDVQVNELRELYDAVIFACGAERDRRMGIPGEHLPGSHTATEFVRWYNAHPDCEEGSFDLTHERAIIVGHGNVATDLCRILMKPVEEIGTTEISDRAVEALSTSRIRELHVLGRRGPAQARFSPKELQELEHIPGCVVTAESSQLELNEASKAEVEASENAAKNLEIFRRFAQNAGRNGTMRVHFDFCVSPSRIRGEEYVEGVDVRRNRLDGVPFGQGVVPTGRSNPIGCGLVLSSIGHVAVPLEGLPFDAEMGTVANVRGKVIKDGVPLSGMYVTGWFKRGPCGVIGTNRADSLETVELVVEELRQSNKDSVKGGHEALEEILEERGIYTVNYDQWLDIDEAEVERGKERAKSREKFKSRREMLRCLSQ